jgi:hypothetical protein
LRKKVNNWGRKRIPRGGCRRNSSPIRGDDAVGQMRLVTVDYYIYLILF